MLLAVPNLYCRYGSGDITPDLDPDRIHILIRKLGVYFLRKGFHAV
jgi:hypothetical protein